MRLLQVDENGELSLTDDLIDSIPPYAILSHTWGGDHEEVSFKDLTKGPRRTIPGYKKLRFCAKRATGDGLQHFWVDTCCIDKSNSVELQEAITSMFAWYQNAAKCYVYLSDVSTTEQKVVDQPSEFTWEPALRVSRWFTRGWTLQELLAPAEVEFFSREGERLGDKRTLERQIHGITRIPVSALRLTPLSAFNVEERMSWAETRQTKRREDKAYSLLGIFNVCMPLMYGEGPESAFNRLQEEIHKKSRPTHYHSDNPLDRLPCAVEAPFNFYHRQHEPTCLPDTRVDLLRDIYNWADREDERTLFWLNGLAGTGKSTIARTVARHYFDKKRLGASFFFSQGGGDVSHASKFVTSVAVQLTTSIPALHKYVSGAVMKCYDIANRSLRDQWHELVLDPLSKLDAKGCQSLYILVVDALDECSNEDDIQIILQLLAEARSLKGVRLRVFLTSRPEIPIRHGFYQLLDDNHQDFVLHNISPSIIDHDIGIFLEYNLKLIKSERSLDSSWPGEEIVGQLVQIACGLFIWAATACRFIREGKRFAAERLNTILKGSGSAVTKLEKHLDNIYITILRSSISAEYTDEEKMQSYSMLRQVLGSIVILFSPLSICSLQKLLHMTKEDISQTLEDLHSVLDIPKDHSQPLRLHHPSFRDFMLNKDRCSESDLWVEEKQAHQKLADCCLQLLSIYLKQDICEINAPGTPATQIDSGQIDHSLSSELQYACLYWIPHLQRSGVQLRDDDQVHRFLQKHLLHWLEALSWMGKVSEAVYAVTVLESIIDGHKCLRLSEYVYDARRFLLSNRQTIEQAPLQVYCSALIFSPTKSIIREQFKDCIPGWIRQLPRVEHNWNALLQTLEGHSDFIHAVAFSPDGRMLASVSSDGAVKLWDTRSGAALQTLEGNSGFSAVAFSPDSRTVASACQKTVQLWDTQSGAALRTIKGHSDLVNAVIFSPDGKILASASNDKTVKLWDAQSRAALQTLKVYSGVNAVAFSPDSRTLASTSDARSIKLWDARSGLELQTLNGHSGVNPVAFSPNGRLLVSTSNNIIKLWDMQSGAALQTLEGHLDQVTAVTFSPDGRMLASASEDWTVKLWDTELESGAVLQTLEGHSNWVTGVAFSPDGRTLASASYDRTIKLWDARSEPGAALHMFESHSGYVRAVAFSPDGRTLASASDDKTVKLWDVRLGVTLLTIKGHSVAVTAVVFSPDGRILASVSSDWTVRLWDARSGVALQTLKHLDYINAIAFSPDSRILASASDDKNVKLWDTQSGVVLHTLNGHLSYANAVPFSHSHYVRAVAFSPDGKMLASASNDKTVKLWDARSGVVLQTLDGHSGYGNGVILSHSHYVRAVAFSPDGRTLVSASDDCTVKLWEARSGAMLEVIEVDAIVYTLSFSDDGLYLTTNIGRLHSTFLSGKSATPRPVSVASIDVKGRWISHDTRDIFWLPPEYAPSSVAVHKSTGGFGCPSGRVFIIEFDFHNFP